ncbi:RNA methyltransferase [Spirochaetia bacterium]|nr:RNA methyltransferase [Spirochaetia bacterium]
MYNKLTNELAVCGINAVRSLSEVHPEKINRLFLREERLPLFTRLCKNLAERKRPYKMCDDEELERLCKTSHHQGIVAMIHEPVVEPAAPEDLETWAAAEKTGLLLCDIGNDLNLGAIVRSAAFFDASPIILTENRFTRKTEVPSPETDSEPVMDTFVRLSTAAYRAAEGGMEHVEFRSVRSPAAFLRSASKQLVTIGTDPRARIRIHDLPKIIQEQRKKKSGIVLVLGNEETGLPPEVKEFCSILARIPGTGAIESLNVAQAASLFLQELYEQ